MGCDELLDLIKSPIAVATGVLLAFARAQLTRNATGIDKAMTFWALLASIAALCRALLSEGVPLKDFRRIAEAMVDAAREESDPVQLVEAVRLARERLT